MRTISIDRIGEKLVRRLAGHTSRRGILSRLGLALCSGQFLEAAREQQSAPVLAPVWEQPAC